MTDEIRNTDTAGWVRENLAWSQAGGFTLMDENGKPFWKHRNGYWTPVRSADVVDAPSPVVEAPTLDAAHQAVRDVLTHMASLSATARKELRAALDRVEAPLAGRAAQDHALGRAVQWIKPGITGR